MKALCLQSGISGLMFDPDTAAMFSTSKSSHFNRRASWKQQSPFFHLSIPAEQAAWNKSDSLKGDMSYFEDWNK